MADTIDCELMKAAIAAAHMDIRPHKVGAVLLRGTLPSHANPRTILDSMLQDLREKGIPVVRNNDGYLLAVAHGGHPWPGDHAESGLLGHKLRNENIQGATLYVTLEPCVNTRHWVRNGEMSCCEIIAKAGIGRVFVGMKDPNPVIYRHGLRRLDMDGIHVELFPEELCRQCEVLNREWIEKQSIKWRYEQIFAALEGHRGPRVQGHRGVAVNDALSMLLCPFIKEGWRASRVIVQHDSTPLPIRESDRELYELYKAVFWKKKRFDHDNPKVMLTKRPWATTDAETLVLDTRETKYSYIQFYKDVVSATEARRARLFDEIGLLGDVDKAEREALIRGIGASAQGHRERLEQVMDYMTGPSDQALDFPHALCLHMTIATRDDKLLITCRAPQSEYRPSTWSCSLEEHMATPDLRPRSEGAILRWAQRAMREELGLQEDTYDPKNVRILAVFLESDILNLALCGWVKLKVDSRALAAMLRSIPHADDEMTAWDFLDYSERTLISEILWARQVNSYHPTSQFRMLMALMKTKGFPRNAAKWLPEWSVPRTKTGASRSISSV